ncbi:hypothetical protein DFH29DRAFT_495139 [Suillus ampliporus]|nr:hypothetical protein DFH29DRAFT_495139 [Suillus ampliporus]
MHASAGSNLPFASDSMVNIPVPLVSSPSNPIVTEAFDDLPTKCSTPCTLLLASPIQKPKHFSVDSDATLVARDDDSVKDFSDDASDDIKDSERFVDEHGFSETDFSGSLLPGTGTLTPDDSDPSQRPQLILLDEHQTTSANPDIALPNYACPVSALTRTMKVPTLDSILTPSATPRLKPPDTKRTADRLPLGQAEVRTSSISSDCLAWQHRALKHDIRQHTTMIDE